MKRCLLLFLWCAWGISLLASAWSGRFPSLEPLLRSIDAAMEEHTRYVDIREQRIRGLKLREQVRPVSSRSYFPDWTASTWNTGLITVTRLCCTFVGACSGRRNMVRPEIACQFG